MTKNINQVYRERNMYATALAAVIGELPGFDAGYYYDGSKWPVVWFQSGDKQAGAHVTPAMASLLEESQIEAGAPEGGV